MSSEWSANSVRKAFLSFFMEKGHTLCPSSPLIPEDSTAFFTSNGINQHFKSIILGKVDPENDLRRACSSQKCIDIGESHEDIEKVGSLYHPHTFFELLGNWSFGDYFKKEAIEWAWELLTKVYGLQAQRICVTYFGGDENNGIAPDYECRDIWLHLHPSLLVMPRQENFWEMGDTGLCGPCSKIYYVREEDQSGIAVELWSLAFIQYDNKSHGSLKPLHAKFVDTRMILERLTSLLQHKMSSYDIDTFLHIYENIYMTTAVTEKYCQPINTISEAYRVVADHIRALSFAIADGATFGEEGREQALRRIFHRAIRYAMQELGAKEGFMNRAATSLAMAMGDVFQELKEHQENIIKILDEEEATFCKTMQLIMDLSNEKATDQIRAKAVNKLFKEKYKDLAHLLWYSQGSASFLFKEIAHTSPSPTLTWDRANHISRLLGLLVCVAAIPEATVTFLHAGLQDYLVPFVVSTSKEKPMELVRNASLDVLMVLLKVADALGDEVKILIRSKILESCLRSLPVGDYGSRLVAVQIIEKIIFSGLGLQYVTMNRDRLFEVTHGLFLMASMVEPLHLEMLKSVVHCLERLSHIESVCFELKRSLPRSFRDNKFVDMLKADSSTLSVLRDLQRKLNM
uniref:alanine--tRNA ligase n=2 Tax=Noccaea caerulescens TaxID=107243 RepID=A0A1J3JAJ3_NOCCA